MAEAQGPILEVRGLGKSFDVHGSFGRVKARLKAVDDVSFSLARGEVLGLVGESGCGKSTLGKTIMGIHEPTAGEVLFEGKRIAGGGFRRDNAMRARVQSVWTTSGSCRESRSFQRGSSEAPGSW